MWPKAKRPSAARERASVHPRADLTGWRRQQLVRAGFDADLAASAAADCAIDLHALIELVERGCPPRLAARIMAPLDHQGKPC
jgi:hypothetical protein